MALIQYFRKCVMICVRNLMNNPAPKVRAKRNEVNPPSLELGFFIPERR